MKIFIADDSAILRERLTSLLLEIKSVQIVGEAWDTQEAIHLFPLLKPDVVILDLHMPGGGGMKVLQSIKMSNSSPIAIIFTNYSFEAYKTKYIQAGADYFLDKSEEFQKIPQILNRLVFKNRLKLYNANLENRSGLRISTKTRENKSA